MKVLNNYDFEFVENISPIIDKKDSIREFFPQNGYKNEKKLELNKYGAGSFCKFSIHPKWSGVSGVYAIYVDENLVYIGQCVDFAKRFNAGYGSISPRNCYEHGQSTNCKINKLILESAKNNKIISLYFYKTEKIMQVEDELIKFYNPQYNDMLKHNSFEKNKIPEQRIVKKNNITEIINNNPSVEQVREYIRNKLLSAKKQGLKELILMSGEIHKELKMNDAKPTVCSAMKTLGSNYKFEVLETPLKGNGSRLILKYELFDLTNYKNPTVNDVRSYIKTKLLEEKEKGINEVVLKAGNIHNELNMQNAMPTVCCAMKTLGNEYNYLEIEVPPKGNGSRLKFKYILNK
ncbi:MAG: GIY-YIG nuclease family protein [Eubacteriaceae bacterium]